MGDSKIKVINFCGEPILKDKAVRDDTEWEVWTYDYSHSLYFIVSFFAGKVVKIESELKYP